MENVIIENLVKDYVNAWGEADPVKRKVLLDKVWEAEGAYTDPTVDLANRDELVNWIGKFLGESPGTRFTLEGKIDTHHNHVRFFWRLHFPDGSQAPGMDYGEISAGGKLKRIVGFF